LAVVFEVKKFEVYLQRRHFIGLTVRRLAQDHLQEC
jgi:hypothetical protein